MRSFFHGWSGAFEVRGLSQSLGMELREHNGAFAGGEGPRSCIFRERATAFIIDDSGQGIAWLICTNLFLRGSRSTAFTKAIGTEAVTVSIIPQILAMAAALKLQVTGGRDRDGATGPITLPPAELPLLAQGWYFRRPLPAAEFQLLLRVDDERAAKANVGLGLWPLRESDWMGPSLWRLCIAPMICDKREMRSKLDAHDEVATDQLEMLAQAFCEQLMACLDECAYGRKGLFSDVELLSDEGQAAAGRRRRAAELAVALQGLFAQQERQNAVVR